MPESRSDPYDLIHLGLVDPGQTSGSPKALRRQQGPDHLPPQRPRHRGRRAGRSWPTGHPADRGHHRRRHHARRCEPDRATGSAVHRRAFRSPVSVVRSRLRPHGHSARAPPCTPGSRWSPRGGPAVAVTGDDPRHDTNMAFVFTPRPARTPVRTSRPRAEPVRPQSAERQGSCRSGRCPARQHRTAGTDRLLADVLDRDGAALSASATRQRNWPTRPPGHPSDDLSAETQVPASDRTGSGPAALPPGYRQDLSPRPWLFPPCGSRAGRTGPAELIRTVSPPVTWQGAGYRRRPGRRIRPRVAPLLPGRRPWSSRSDLPDPTAGPIWTIAAMMDNRKERLGQHAAQTAPHGDATLARYRDRSRDDGRQGVGDRRLPGTYGYDHPRPDGPEPPVTLRTSGLPGRSVPRSRPTMGRTSAACRRQASG